MFDEELAALSEKDVKATQEVLHNFSLFSEKRGEDIQNLFTSVLT